MVKQQGIGTSHAKIILMGEHSVVYGQPAIALPLPSVQLSVTLSSRQDNQRIIKSRYYHGSLENLPSSMLRRFPQVTFSEMERLSSCAKLLIMVIITSPLASRV